MLSVLSFSVITLQDEGDSNDSDDEENNWPELSYGIYKNPTPGPSWREDDEVSPNPAWSAQGPFAPTWSTTLSQQRGMYEGLGQRSGPVSRKVIQYYILYRDVWKKTKLVWRILDF